MAHWTSHITVKINGETASRSRLRATGSTSQTLANARRMADAIAPTTGECHGRCKCKPCVANRHHQWAILRAVYRWSLTKIAAVMIFDHSTVQHGIAKISGMAGMKNRAYVRAVPGKRMRNYVRKTRLQTVAQRRKEWGSKEMQP